MEFFSILIALTMRKASEKLCCILFGRQLSGLVVRLGVVFVRTTISRAAS